MYRRINIISERGVEIINKGLIQHIPDLWDNSLISVVVRMDKIPHRTERGGSILHVPAG